MTYSEDFCWPCSDFFCLQLGDVLLGVKEVLDAADVLTVVGPAGVVPLGAGHKAGRAAERENEDEVRTDTAETSCNAIHSGLLPRGAICLGLCSPDYLRLGDGARFVNQKTRRLLVLPLSRSHRLYRMVAEVTDIEWFV